ncbi:MAG: helix-turn-helix domain-containing protein [Dehalococcoidales bacterium]|nr:helix-turn-helix domain-containing protein [Dehalococcoidales bacterium]
MIHTMGVKELGQIIKAERQRQNLKLVELQDLSGVSRQTISSMEKGKRGQEAGADTIIRIANALKISPTPMLEALGAEYTEISYKNKLPIPDKYPIYKDFPFHAGLPVRPVDYYYRTFPGKATKNIEGYIVHGTCLEPDIKESDVIIVDRDGAIDNGDIVACRMETGLCLGRLRKISDELYLETNEGRVPLKDCIVAAPVIEINRRIKNK